MTILQNTLKHNFCDHVLLRYMATWNTVSFSSLQDNNIKILTHPIQFSRPITLLCFVQQYCSCKVMDGRRQRVVGNCTDGKDILHKIRMVVVSSLTVHIRIFQGFRSAGCVVLSFWVSHSNIQDSLLFHTNYRSIQLHVFNNSDHRTSSVQNAIVFHSRSDSIGSCNFR
jgi:hypothetical protein